MARLRKHLAQEKELLKRERMLVTREGEGRAAGEERGISQAHVEEEGSYEEG